jgi:hypothetical protein
LDGIEIGKSPLKYKNALTGKHIIKIIEQECGNKIEKEIEIEEGIINTIEEAIPLVFFNDYEKAKIGDYFYIDGTLSHRKSEDKKAVGVVFTLETTEEEKKGKFVCSHCGANLSFEPDDETSNENADNE